MSRPRDGCASSNLNLLGLIGDLNLAGVACANGDAARGSPVSARNEALTWTALVLEMVALRHQIAVLKRSGTRRPCFRFQDRLFWLLLARWWPSWRDSLVIVQPATILRWRREGWSGLWRYRSGGRWRGGRPRIPRELRRLIVRMARENFLWGAPRIHGELLMLGFTVSQATVSRYMPPANRRPGQSWRTFIRNKAVAFRHDNDSEDESAGNNAGLGIRFYRGIRPRFLTSVIGGRVTYDYRHPLPLSQCSSNSLRSQPHHRGLLHQARRPLAVSGKRSWSACRTAHAQPSMSCSGVIGTAFATDSGGQIN